MYQNSITFHSSFIKVVSSVANRMMRPCKKSDIFYGVPEFSTNNNFTRCFEHSCDTIYTEFCPPIHIPSLEICIIFNLGRLEISLPPSFIRIQESVSFTFMDLQVFLLLFSFLKSLHGINFIKTQSNVGGYLGLYLGVSLVEV